jgi:hypothetical protein
MRTTVPLLTVLLACSMAMAQPAGQRKQPFPHIELDVQSKQVRIACQAIRIDAPLEFLCVSVGGNEHEAALRSPALPEHIHASLLMVGLTPGQPVRYSEAAKKWLPPHGPPLQITLEWTADGKEVSIPAYRLLRNIQTKKPMPSTTWIFAGSRVMEDGTYAANVTGYIVSIVNFDLTVIDIPDLASSVNETLEWEINPDIAPPANTPVTMILQPAGRLDNAPATQPATTEPAEQSNTAAPDEVRVDEARMNALRERWERAVAPHNRALRQAAQTHYEVINQLRREQQRLIDEADRIQRVIDELETAYQEMTTPRPEPVQ